MRKPDSGLLEESELILFADYYEYTSGKANFDHKANYKVTENYFIRKIPQGSYLIAAGLEQVIADIMTMMNGLNGENKEWLEKTSGRDFNEGFLDYLSDLHHDIDIYAVREGTPVFPNEPIINITGPSIDVQLFETDLLTVQNFQSLVATKASRMINVAKNRSTFFDPSKTVLDFGARRAHGRDAAILAARASFIGGFDGTSLMIAGKKWNIPYVGTVPHKFIQERDPDEKEKDTETKAFREYVESFPHNAVLLVDTYSTLHGIEKAIVIGKELGQIGHELKGIRLDSGDLLDLSKRARTMLDSAGLTNTKIFASSDLDEYQIEYLVSNSAPIDGWGVGTRMVTGANYNSITKEGGVSALGGIYKLVEKIDYDGRVIPKFKISDDKAKNLLPGKKQIYRKVVDGKFVKDKIALWDEKIEEEGWQPLLVPIMLGGKQVYDFPEVRQIKTYTLQQLSCLDEKYKRLNNSVKYPVSISSKLQELTNRLYENFKVESR